MVKKRREKIAFYHISLLYSLKENPLQYFWYIILECCIYLIVIKPQGIPLIYFLPISCLGWGRGEIGAKLAMLRRTNRQTD